MILTDGLCRKLQMVKALSKVYSEAISNVVSLDYVLFLDKDGELVEEYLLVNFVGGGFVARNCYINSCSAVAEEAARYLNGGYYKEVDDYKNLVSSGNYTIIKASEYQTEN